MYSNPQSAFPLAPKPKVEQYKNIAKDLVTACRNAQAGDEQAVGRWAESWIEALARLQVIGKDLSKVRNEVNRKIDELERVVGRTLVSRKEKCRIGDAQFIVARAHGFESWSKLVRHIKAVSDKSSAIFRYESAADAIVEGNLRKLKRLLKQDP